MIELSEQNAADYLRRAGRASPAGELLFQSTSTEHQVILRVFDMAAGEKIGTDLRSPAQIKQGKPDPRMHQGDCFVLRQHRPPDSAALQRQQECLSLLSTLLPAGCVPSVRWADDNNGILATACPPPGAVIWRKELVAGRISMDAATHAGMLLAMLHSATHGDPALAQQFSPDAPGAPTREHLPAVLEQLHPPAAQRIAHLRRQVASARHCLIHGDFVPENLLLIPLEIAPDVHADPSRRKPPGMAVVNLLLQDFASVSLGHPAVDLAALCTPLLHFAFLQPARWRSFMLLADNFWQTYRQTTSPDLVRLADALAGHLVGALLAHLTETPDGAKATGAEPDLAPMRRAASAILDQPDGSLEQAMDILSIHLNEPA